MLYTECDAVQPTDHYSKPLEKPLGPVCDLRLLKDSWEVKRINKE